MQSDLKADFSTHPNLQLLPLLALSLSLTVAGKVADNIWLTWQQVCEAFQREAAKINTVKDGLLYVFAHFSQDYKIGSQITDLFAVCLDFDHQTTEQLNNCIQLAQRLSTRGIVHTTWSDDINNPNGRCFRVLVPLDVPVPIAQWADTWQTFATAFAQHAGAVADGQCKNPNRRYYVPSTRSSLAGPIVPQHVVPVVICWGE